MKTGKEPKKYRARGFIPSALSAFFAIDRSLCELGSFRRMLLLALLITASTGCKKVPEGRDAIDVVDLEGVPEHLEAKLESGLATKSTPTLWFIERVYDYETLDKAALARDLERIERQLKRRGYYEAKVSAARIIRTQEDRVRVEIQIEAGPPVKIRNLETSGLARLPFEVAEAATQEMTLRVGRIFDEEEFENAKQEVANSLANRGYAFARVSGKATIDLANHSATVKLKASPGRRATIGPVSIEGLEELEEGPIRRVLKIHTGDIYSRKDLQQARAALFQLGVFSRVELTPQLDHPESDTVPITIRLEESPLRDVTLGAGARLDLTRLAVVGQAGWTHYNFLGGLRKFSASTRPGLTFFPTSVDYLKAPTAVFPENFLELRLEQPGFIEGRTRGFAEAGYNVYPLLYPLPEDTDPRDERVIGYNEITSSMGVERGFFGRLLFTNASLNWQANLPFAYQGESDIEGLNTVMVAYPELITHVDFRDDPLQPKTGIFISNSLQVGLPVLGGDIFDIRIRPELRTFVPLDQKHNLIFAARFGVGMVFPLANSYGEALTEAGNNLDYSDPLIVEDQHKLLFRAFYSGGSNSNRGYPNQRIGPQGAISFLLPKDEDCTGNNPPPTCIRPLGGFSLWEASLELRYRAFENWSFVGFIDASDVSIKTAYFSFAEPHVAIGPGLRYLSPVGPVRVDVGWRVPGLQKIRAVPDEPPDISEVAPYVDDSWYDGFTLHILIGESF